MKNIILITLLILQTGIYVNAQQKGTFTDSRDGHVYKTVKIGNQVWMAENLNYTQGIPYITDKTAWVNLDDNNSDAAWCYCANDPENSNKYGVLYTYAAALKVAPKGWHLPTKEEFETLLNQLGGEREEPYKALIKGGKSDLNVLLGGSRSKYGNFINIGLTTGFWSATELNNTCAWYYYLFKNIKEAYITNGNKSVGFSVRLIKD